MFRKDFKLERLAQDEESRKVELAEKQKALSGAKKRMEDLDRLIQHIYEDNVLGELSDSRYLKWSRQYEKEQAGDWAACRCSGTGNRGIGRAACRCERVFVKYLDNQELDAAILNELVSKIVVHSPVKENGRKQVRIDLHFTYVGQIRIPWKIERDSLNESEPAWPDTPVPTAISFTSLWDAAYLRKASLCKGNCGKINGENIRLQSCLCILYIRKKNNHKIVHNNQWFGLRNVLVMW